ncbi:Hypothetical protein CM240_1579 [Clostridium bornimense]|uniref:Uncharacterized protein n=1 Tax=Clostridium bornimense TaxID=1216932 RepID=W6S354_9CLOT|nr:hypothetical protein [Clostridium bornimense]CDM68737.1 Hypothetical protein CM240_1579 [Clostridium bornimense]
MNRKKGFIVIDMLLSIALFLYLSIVVIKVIDKNTKVGIDNSRIKNNMRILNVIREKVLVDSEKDYHIMIPEENLTINRLTSNKVIDLSGKKGDKYVEVYKYSGGMDITLYERVEDGYEVYKVKN